MNQLWKLAVILILNEWVIAVKNLNENLNYFNIQSLITRAAEKYKIKKVTKSDNCLFTDCSRSCVQNTSKSMWKMLQKLKVLITKNLLIKISFKYVSKKNWKCDKQYLIWIKCISFFLTAIRMMMHLKKYDVKRQIMTIKNRIIKK